MWARDPKGGPPVLYRDVRYQEELQLSVYNFEAADVSNAWKHLELYEAECQALINKFNAMTASKNVNENEWKRFPLLGAFDLCLKCSHLFNILDARGAISVTERVGVIARIRQLAVGLAKAYLAQQSAPPREQKQQKEGAA
jgi:glycyl-tRNA synthetase alpha chain